MFIQNLLEVQSLKLQLEDCLKAWKYKESLQRESSGRVGIQRSLLKTSKKPLPPSLPLILIYSRRTWNVFPFGFWVVHWLPLICLPLIGIFLKVDLICRLSFCELLAVVGIVATIPFYYWLLDCCWVIASWLELLLCECLQDWIIGTSVVFWIDVTAAYRRLR